MEFGGSSGMLWVFLRARGSASAMEPVSLAQVQLPGVSKTASCVHCILASMVCNSAIRVQAGAVADGQVPGVLM